MKSYKKIAALLSAVTLLCGAVYAAPAAEKGSAVQEAAKTVSSVKLPYTYESAAYGYRIMCPKQPVGVIPASALFENREGEVLIFENEEYHIKYAWVVLVNAFSDNAVPDLNKINPEEAVKLLGGIMGSNGYEGIMLVNLSDSNKAIFATTAKEVEIDEDGDGVVDATASADSQMALLFFRGENGQRYGLELIDNPELRSDSLSAFIEGARTLHAMQ
jgi:hypothetical protein